MVCRPCATLRCEADLADPAMAASGRRPAVADMPPWPCPGGHHCRVRGSQLPGGGARRYAACLRCCPAGTMLPGMKVWWSCHAVRLPPAVARVAHRRLR